MPGHKQNFHNKTQWSMTTCCSTQHLQIKARLTTFSLKDGQQTKIKKAFEQKVILQLLFDRQGPPVQYYISKRTMVT
jgi:hypothetical protein